MSAEKPKENFLKNADLSSAFMGFLGVLLSSSSVSGGGILLRSQVLSSNGARKSSPVKKGIHHSETPLLLISHLPALLTIPEEKIKLTLSPAPMNSVCLRPSRKLKTSPQTIPRGRPLRKRAKILRGTGSIAKRKRAISDSAIRARMAMALLLRPNSDTNRIPINLERV